jgi:hypothetical protein
VLHFYHPSSAWLHLPMFGQMHHGPDARCAIVGQVQLCFLVDVTGSMQSWITAVANQVTQIVDYVADRCACMPAMGLA